MMKTCDYCHQEFDGRPDQRFCSSKCKVRNHRAKQHQNPSEPNDGSPGYYPKSDIELEVELEKEKLRLAHEERMKVLDFQQSEKLRLQEYEEREKQYQRDLDVAEAAIAREIAALREETKQKAILAEELKSQVDEKSKWRRDKKTKRQKQKETSSDIGDDSILTLGALGLGAILLTNMLGKKKPPTLKDENSTKL